MESYIVDVTLYTGKHYQSNDFPKLRDAIDFANTLVLRTMVDLVDVIDTKTGEIKHSTNKTLAAQRLA